MQDIIKFFDEFSEILQDKIDAIEQNNVTKLEQIMKQEQAFSMKIRGLEKSRQTALAQSGLTQEDFKIVMQSPQDDEEIETAAVYRLLKERLAKYTQASEVIQAQVDIRLHSIKLLLEKLENNPLQGIYDKSGIDKTKAADDFKSTKA